MQLPHLIEPQHGPFSLSEGQMRVFYRVVEPAAEPIRGASRLADKTLLGGYLRVRITCIPLLLIAKLYWQRCQFSRDRLLFSVHGLERSSVHRAEIVDGHRVTT